MRKPFLLMLLLSVMSLTAHAQKFALIDMEYILKNIPAYESANQQMEQSSEQWQAEVEKLAEEAKAMYEDYQSTAQELTAEQRTQKEDAIVAKEKEVADLRRKYFGPEGEMAKMQARLMGPIQDDIYNAVKAIEAYLHGHGLFRKNIVTGKCEISTDDGKSYADLTDRHVNSLWREMCKEGRMIRSLDMRALLESDLVELYNPFETYFQSLPAWDRSTDPIAKLAATVHVKTGAELFPSLFKKWLVAMVASLLHEEVVNHQILVLLGRQGIYKTTWLNNLLPPELRRYFYLKSNSRNISKDDLLVLSEFAIVCLEELDELNDKELSQLKALTTQRHINERAAYAHYKEVRTHIASFCGTGNNLHFLTDPTGNRRWMPFEVESIDSPYDHPVDYAAVYAQAYTLVKEDFPYWLDNKELRLLNEHNRLFEAPNLERELVLTYYQVPAEGEECVFLTNAEILKRINAGLRHPLSAVKLGTIMSQEGFPSVRVGGKRGYKVIELSGEQIENRKRWVTHWT